jgi:hypothetical protein
MKITAQGSTVSLVEAVDRVTRAVHIGARLPGSKRPPFDAIDRSYLGGFIAALVDALDLDEGFAELVVYAYLLQEGLAADAARLSRIILFMPEDTELRRAYVTGRAEAVAVAGSEAAEPWPARNMAGLKG